MPAPRTRILWAGQPQLQSSIPRPHRQSYTFRASGCELVAEAGESAGPGREGRLAGVAVGAAALAAALTNSARPYPAGVNSTSLPPQPARSPSAGPAPPPRPPGPTAGCTAPWRPRGARRSWTCRSQWLTNIRRPAGSGKTPYAPSGARRPRPRPTRTGTPRRWDGRWTGSGTTPTSVAEGARFVPAAATPPHRHRAPSAAPRW